ncbi:hypothetical protein SPI02_08350 [Staphylococcus piscifermentans]|uniref:Uncharacterized protein n=1 Tax=Staphylococcus piscifermentans TaxID=70258 RepID=A0A512QLF1_9STAP|nr:hypothetical protein SPI02_08350 [Staphylococcus piscifermentans]
MSILLKFGLKPETLRQKSLLLFDTDFIIDSILHNVAQHFPRNYLFSVELSI